MPTSTLPNIKRFVTSGLIIWNNSVLLIEHRKYGRWMLPGGHIDENERPDEALSREIFEELGISVEIRNPSWHKSLTGDGAFSAPTPIAVLQENVPALGSRPAAWHVDFIYLCTPSSTVPTFSEDDIKNSRWVRLEELKTVHTFETVRRLIECVLQGWAAS